MHFYPIAITLLSASLLASSAFSQVFLDETFEDDNREIQAPPSSLAYFLGDLSKGIRESDGKLVIGGGGNRYLMAYLTEPGDYLSVDVGEAISLEVTVKVDVDLSFNKTVNCRIGLINSGDVAGSTRAITSDGFDSKEVGFQPFLGYLSSIDLSHNRGDPQLRAYKRTPGVTELFLLGANAKATGPKPYNRIAMGDFAVYDPSQTFIIQLNVMRTSQSGLKIMVLSTEAVPGLTSTVYSCEVEDLEDQVLDFDTFVFGTQGGRKAVKEIEIERIRVFKVAI